MDCKQGTFKVELLMPPAEAPHLPGHRQEQHGLYKLGISSLCVQLGPECEYYAWWQVVAGHLRYLCSRVRYLDWRLVMTLLVTRGLCSGLKRRITDRRRTRG